MVFDRIRASPRLENLDFSPIELQQLTPARFYSGLTDGP